MIKKYIFLYTIYLFFGVCILTTVYLTDILDQETNIYVDDLALRRLLSLEGEPCLIDKDCNNGKCEMYSEGTQCVCDEGYLTVDGDICNYKQRKSLTTFLLSFLVGVFGTDWFYLSRGVGIYIFAGVMKCLTCGCCGIWWLVDWIRVLTDGFPDGLGHALYNNM